MNTRQIIFESFFVFTVVFLVLSLLTSSDEEKTDRKPTVTVEEPTIVYSPPGD